MKKTRSVTLVQWFRMNPTPNLRSGSGEYAALVPRFTPTLAGLFTSIVGREPVSFYSIGGDEVISVCDPKYLPEIEEAVARFEKEMGREVVVQCEF